MGISTPRKQRPWGLALLFGVIVSISATVCGLLVLTIYLMLYGGQAFVHEFWAVDGKGYQGLVKWPMVVIGYPLGLLAGVWIWCRVVIKMGLLTHDEMNKMLGR